MVLIDTLLNYKNLVQDLYTTMGEYSLNARVESAIEGQEGLPTVLDICRRHDSGK